MNKLILSGGKRDETDWAKFANKNLQWECMNGHVGLDQHLSPYLESVMKCKGERLQ